MILAIETALKTASLAILDESKVLGSRLFGKEISMSQNLVAEIDTLLAECLINKKDLKLIAVSNGPGSLTGIRVGVSVGMGLAAALGIDCVGIALPEALRENAQNEKVITIISGGKDQVYWQFFSRESIEEIKLIKYVEIADQIKEHPEANLSATSDLFEVLENLPISSKITYHENPAELVALSAFNLSKKGKLPQPSPIYFQQNLYKKL